MRGALDEGGKAIGVLADSLERAAMNRENRDMLIDGQLVLVSPYDPSAGFNVGNAMQRNKLIYALADAALVVSSDFEKGGTWAGAIEQLDRLRMVPVYVRSRPQSFRRYRRIAQEGCDRLARPRGCAGIRCGVRGDFYARMAVGHAVFGRGDSGSAARRAEGTRRLDRRVEGRGGPTPPTDIVRNSPADLGAWRRVAKATRRDELPRTSC